MSQALKITKYFRDSLAANLKIDFKKESYEIVNLDSLMSGKVDEKHYKNLAKGNKGQRDAIDIVIVAKAIKTVFEGQQKVNNDIDELTGIFYIPAVISSEGKLNPPEEKYPWIPREHLSPLIDNDLAIGELKDYDEFMSDNFQRINSELTW
ncbi:DNA helicase, partial [Priestia sp. BR_2]